jgi:hypothetical protein
MGSTFTQTIFVMGFNHVLRAHILSNLLIRVEIHVQNVRCHEKRRLLQNNPFQQFAAYIAQFGYMGT